MRTEHHHDAHDASVPQAQGRPPATRLPMQTVPSLEYDMAEQQHRYLRPLLVAVLAPVLLSGCTRETPNGMPVDVTLKDFSITPATQTITTGDVLLRASNEAPIIHEFI